MRWYVTFALWTTLLGAWAWLGGDAYRSLLSECTMRMLQILGYHVKIDQLQLVAPADLAFFAALSMAAYWLPLSSRLGLVVRGLPILMAVELLTAIPAVLSCLADAAGLLPPVVARFRDQFMASISWLSGPIVWTALIGPARVPLLTSRRFGSRPRALRGGPTARPVSRSMEARAPETS